MVVCYCCLFVCLFVWSFGHSVVRSFGRLGGVGEGGRKNSDPCVSEANQPLTSTLSSAPITHYFPTPSSLTSGHVARTSALFCFFFQRATEERKEILGLLEGLDLKWVHHHLLWVMFIYCFLILFAKRCRNVTCFVLFCSVYVLRGAVLYCMTMHCCSVV